MWFRGLRLAKGAACSYPGVGPKGDGGALC
jgi:hypothetical protein